MTKEKIDLSSVLIETKMQKAILRVLKRKKIISNQTTGNSTQRLSQEDCAEIIARELYK